MEFIHLYYYFINLYFHVGLKNTKNNYIKFRKWSQKNIDISENLIENFYPKYSWDKFYGQIYSYQNVHSEFVVDKSKFLRALQNNFDDNEIKVLNEIFIKNKKIFYKYKNYSKLSIMLNRLLSYLNIFI